MANDAVSMDVVVDVRTDVVGEPAYWIDNVERPALVLPVETTYTFNIDADTFATLGGHHFPVLYE